MGRWGSRAHNGQLGDGNWISPRASGSAPRRVGNSAGPEEKGALPNVLGAGNSCGKVRLRGGMYRVMESLGLGWASPPCSEQRGGEGINREEAGREGFWRRLCSFKLSSVCNGGATGSF